MGKRRGSDVDCSPRVADDKRPRPGSKHLYLALDDWDKGYSIHKVIDLHDSGAGHLREPPLLRLEASRGSHDVLFAAIGSNILALWQPRNSPTRAVVYDTGTAGVLADGPAHPSDLHAMRFVASAGGRLYALHGGGLHCLEEAPPPDSASYYYGSRPDEDARWAWTRACSPLRLPFVTDDGAPAPWGPIEITSYAVHPDGRTVFVSARGTHHRYFGTFSLDTGRHGGGGEWTRHGEWLLPFRGQGHYDSTLDAWVGLHSPGYMCACDVPLAGSGEKPQRPEWKLVKAEQLFVTDPENGVLRQSFMTLASMGNAEYCILEPLTTEGTELTLDMELGDEYLLRLTKFRIKRDLHGQLRASSRRVARSYRLRKYDHIFSPQAFWL